MSKMFDSQVKHYKEKFHNTVDNISIKAIEVSAKSAGYSDETLKQEFMDNTNNFRVFCHKFAKTLMPGHVSCTTYAAVVAVIANKYDIPYTAYAGFCLPKNNPRYEEELSTYKERLTKEEHPMFATHVYLNANGIDYEYYNGDTANIDHIDCVTI